MRCLETIVMQQFCLEHLQLIICICFQPPDSVNHEMLDQVKEAGVVEKENVPNKKRHRPKALKSPKVKKDMRGPRAPKPEGSPSVQLVRSAKKTAEIMINGINIDISVIPILYKKAWFEDSREKRMNSGVFKVVLEKLAGEHDPFHEFKSPAIHALVEHLAAVVGLIYACVRGCLGMIDEFLRWLLKPACVLSPAMLALTLLEGTYTTSQFEFMGHQLRGLKFSPEQLEALKF
ncbi:hypothetical protein POTOM_050228 [Populus tomentosa]|uniref:GAGA-binding transcriptional activator n=1 Tax=Populus tomentosa TaxID=118781 RepID=A0A8X7Y8T2_POPTO|nr:hypothetical protein POTOM_050228 [Populus tomentosa]